MAYQTATARKPQSVLRCTLPIVYFHIITMGYKSAKSFVSFEPYGEACNIRFGFVAAFSLTVLLTIRSVVDMNLAQAHELY